jgi:NADH-quinone oxidoreductase subunit E
VNSLLDQYPREVELILSKYPPEEKRAAVMPLLYLAQREMGYVKKQALADIGEILDLSTTDVVSIVGFYTLYHEHPGGRYRIQVCNDLPCALRGADEFLEKLCENLGIRVGETSQDGLVTVEAVMCLAACDKAPMFQVQTGEGIHYHENQSVESALKLVEDWRDQEKASGARSELQKREVSDKDETIAHFAKTGTTSLDREQRVRLQEKGGQ